MSSLRKRIGDVMPANHRFADWIYAGFTKDQNGRRRAFYLAAKDSGVFTSAGAVARAANVARLAHLSCDTVRAPTRPEWERILELKERGALKTAFKAKAKKTDEKDKTYPDGHYWVSQPGQHYYPERIVMTDKSSAPWYEGTQASLRLVAF